MGGSRARAPDGKRRLCLNPNGYKYKLSFFLKMLFTKKKIYVSKRGSNWGDDGASVFIPELGWPSELSRARMESGTSSTPKLDNFPTWTDLPHGKVTLPLCGFYSETF